MYSACHAQAWLNITNSSHASNDATMTPMFAYTADAAPLTSSAACRWLALYAGWILIVIGRSFAWLIILIFDRRKTIFYGNQHGSQQTLSYTIILLPLLVYYIVGRTSHKNTALLFQQSALYSLALILMYAIWRTFVADCILFILGVPKKRR